MNPITLFERTAEQYRQYLASTFHFRDPVLRASFRSALEQETISKGPFLEATPNFNEGLSLRNLTQDLLSIDSEPLLKGLPADRPLYRHQEDAVRTFLKDENFVVATGTGSGKTESFLYPILLHLLEQHHAGTLQETGVRALILYPMNALANDQRERIGQIASELRRTSSTFEFTFGQYTGETPDDENDRNRTAVDRQPGELIYRKEMRERPPHILLTNFSMLEYLFIRPWDSELFDNGHARHWRFIVLDEAHQYNGSKGIEMAMLIRRLKQRLREGGREEPFRCIATSATIGGDDRKNDVARFAQELFGEPFFPEAVITASRRKLDSTDRIRLNGIDYLALQETLQQDELDELTTLLRSSVRDVKETEPLKMLGEVLLQDTRCNQLRRILQEEGAQTVRELADLIFSDESYEASRIEQLGAVVSLLSRAQLPGIASPTNLLWLRYHHFLRALEGAYITYSPEASISLNRRSVPGAAAFELALCRECGQHYFVGREERFNGKVYLTEAVRDPARVDPNTRYYLPNPADDLEMDGDTVHTILRLCTSCGQVGDQLIPSSECRHEHQLRVLRLQPRQRDGEETDELKRCVVCGYGAKAADPVREVVHGNEGPHSVIATALCNQLPSDRRKLLAFTDSRQQAAFFAWYLENSYGDLIHRNLIHRAMLRLPFDSDGLTLDDALHSLLRVMKDEGMFRANESNLQRKQKADRFLWRELFSEERRISLEGVGLLRVRLAWPEGEKIEPPEVLAKAPWNFDREDALALVEFLMLSCRRQYAVALPDTEIGPEWSDLEVRPRQAALTIGTPDAGEHLKQWHHGASERSRFLKKVLVRRGIDAESAVAYVDELLKAVWTWRTQLDERFEEPLDKVLRPALNDRGRRLNALSLRLHPTPQDDVLYQCEVCGALVPFDVDGACPRSDCPGTLAAIARRDLSTSHYRTLYEEEHLPVRLRSEEHTAQLSYQKATEFQRDFRGNKINVLSSSTTFELGVDLGDLDLVFLRNVPPETFNYLQRVGRAGRRRGYPGMAVTYCRRNPHDLYHWARPKERILGGEVLPPRLNINNDLIARRHLTATLLSFYFRAHETRFKDVQNLLGDFANPTLIDELREFIKGNSGRIHRSLIEIFPDQVKEPLGLNGVDAWFEHAVGPESKLKLAVDERCHEYASTKSFMEDRMNNIMEKGAENDVSWSKRRLNTLRTQEVLSFLSRANVIPKYGFPVDVVSLRVLDDTAGEIKLDRDLSVAISEFAPGSEIVANKHLYASHALILPPQRQWKLLNYMHCDHNNDFVKWSEGETEPAFHCPGGGVRRKYIVPEFGFSTKKGRPSTPNGPTLRLFSTRPYFVGLSDGASPETLEVGGVLTLRCASPGEMVVICSGRRGRGFYVCRQCGAEIGGAAGVHKTVLGKSCNGTAMHAQLGHELRTDVAQLVFHLEPKSEMARVDLAYSVAYALLHGMSSLLQVPANELNVTVGRHDEADSLPPIVLYDDVPGGAGLVQMLSDREVLFDILRAAAERVNGDCGCGDTESCYGCLRNYQNQFQHEALQRGPTLQYLRMALFHLEDGHSN